MLVKSNQRRLRIFYAVAKLPRDQLTRVMVDATKAREGPRAGQLRLTCAFACFAHYYAVEETFDTKGKCTGAPNNALREHSGPLFHGMQIMLATCSLADYPWLITKLKTEILQSRMLGENVFLRSTREQ